MGLAALGVALATASAGGFHQHLVEAVELNRARAGYYAARTQGASAALSGQLIRTELALMPLAAYLDAVARPFQAAGCGILQDDFTSMSQVAEAATPPRYRGIASLASLRALGRTLMAYQLRVATAVREDRLEAIPPDTMAALAAIARAEASEQAHFAMARHLVESVGYTALHALSYPRATRELARNVVGLQAMGVAGAVAVDRWAQELHAMGIGILVNDVPAIPFEAEYQQGRGLPPATPLPHVWNP